MAFLNSELQEEIYMEQYARFLTPKRLTKSLYGLKQTSNQWHKSIDNFILLGDWSKWMW